MENKEWVFAKQRAHIQSLSLTADIPNHFTIRETLSNLLAWYNEWLSTSEKLFMYMVSTTHEAGQSKYVCFE